MTLFYKNETGKKHLEMVYMIKICVQMLGLVHPLAAEMNVAATYFSNLAESVLKNATQMTD